MDRIKVGVIGLGRMGQRHCRIYSNLHKAQLIGVYDLLPEIGQKIACQFEIPHYQRVEELLERVDAVSLATPTSKHFELAMLCMSKGVHVLIEKPITETLEQAQCLVQAVEESGLIVLVGHIERFNPAYMELKNVLIGKKPLAINFRRLSPYKGSNTDVDVVLDLMIHDTNLVLDLLNQEPISINAYGLIADSGTIDHASVQLSFNSGPLLTMAASRMTEYKIRSIEITTRQAYIECDLLNKNISVYRSTIGEYQNNDLQGVKYKQETIVERIFVPSFEPLHLELEHFIECITEQKTPIVSAKDGYDALKLAVTIRTDILKHFVTAINNQSDNPELLGVNKEVNTVNS